jgi:putative ABC transport system substrate-binding protein
MQRRKFIILLGGAAGAFLFRARAQQLSLPVVAFINGGSPITSARYAAAFRTGMKESGYVEGENVTVDYEWLEGQYGRLAALMTDLIRRNVAVIVTPGSNVAALAAKSATTKIPIIFGVGGDPVRLGLVASLTRPGGNATGINIYEEEVMGKRLRLLHDLVPNAVRVGVLVNPANPTNTQTTLREVQKAAPAIGLKIQVINATTASDIEAAFAYRHLDALFISADGFFNSRRVELAILAARNNIPVVFPDSSYVEVGGLMSYGTNLAEMYRRVGLYTGHVLSGTKPADLAVTEFTKFEFVINAQTARALHIDLPPALLAIADDVIR